MSSGQPSIEAGYTVCERKERKKRSFLLIVHLSLLRPFGTNLESNYTAFLLGKILNNQSVNSGRKKIDVAFLV